MEEQGPGSVGGANPSDAELFPLVQHIPMAIVVVTRENRVSLANEAFTQIFGIEEGPDALLGQDCRDLIDTLSRMTSDPAEFARRSKETVESADPATAERIDLSDGRILLRDLIPVNLASGDSRMVWFFRDITGDVRAAEVAEAGRLNAENLAAQRAKLLSLVSHEVRTPLSGVVGLVELLLQEALPDYLQEIVRGIKRSADSVAELLEGLLVVSSLDSGELVLDNRPTDLMELLEDSVEAIGPTARAKGLAVSLRMHPSMPRTATVDGPRLRQIILNLLGNAVKFTDNGEVSLSAEAVNRELRFRVVDSGTGMSAQDIERVFLPFQQGVDAVRKGGAGLGLAIVQSLVKAMGGTAQVDSLPGVGTAFCITIPLEQPQGVTGSSAELRGKRIALSCPHPLATIALVTTLRAAGAEVVGADTVAPDRGVAALVVVAEAASAQAAEQVQNMQIAMRPPRTVVLNVGPPNDMSGAISAPMPVRRSRLIELVDGSAEESRQDQSLVVGESHAQPAASPAVRREPSAALVPRVLVAEDSPANQALIKTMLRRLGAQCQVVADGEAAVAAARSGDFELVIMDLSMPRMDGITATRSIRALPPGSPGRDVPIVGLSASALEDDPQACRQAGMDEFLAKPVSLDDLREVLDRLARPAAAVAVPEQRAESTDPATVSSADSQQGILDRERLASLIEEIGDPQLVRETVEIFLVELAPRLSDIDQSAAARDETALARALHALVSPSAMLGADELALRCREWERECQGEPPERVAERVAVIHGAADATAAAMHTYLTEIHGSRME